MCMGPERVTADAGIDAIPLQWSRQYEGRMSGLPAKALKAAREGNRRRSAPRPGFAGTTW